jgi:hypothetical protein
MPLLQHSILVGRAYRTVANEIREVSAVDKDEVVYRSVFMTGTGRQSVRTPDRRLTLERFAAEAQSEIDGR